MRRRLTRLGVLSVAVAALAAAATACGSRSTTTGPTLDPTLVEGFYTPTVLSFDPQGSLPVANLLDAIGQEVEPYLFIGTDRRFRFLFVDKQTGLPTLAEGSFRMLEDGIRLSFNKASDAAILLLPQNLDLTFDQTAGTLSFSGSIQVPRSRLFELVPDWQNEPLTDPVPGTLTVEFTVIPPQ
ncbi:MAG: hypothetical protein P8099_16550 [Gemmatimonadota bacterium]